MKKNPRGRGDVYFVELKTQPVDKTAHTILVTSRMSRSNVEQTTRFPYSVLVRIHICIAFNHEFQWSTAIVIQIYSLHHLCLLPSHSSRLMLRIPRCTRTSSSSWGTITCISEKTKFVLWSWCFFEISLCSISLHYHLITTCLFVQVGEATDRICLRKKSVYLIWLFHSSRSSGEHRRAHSVLIHCAVFSLDYGLT